MQRLTEVLQRLKEAGLKIKPSKCHLLCKSVRYLGYVVSEKCIAADADKIKCVENRPTPTDHECLRQFLGLLPIIGNTADTAAPLHALTEKSKPWHWTELCDKAFVALKGKLASPPPILSYPLFDRTFVVDADASQEGVGAVLSHLDNGRVIAYASKVLTKADANIVQRDVLSCWHWYGRFVSFGLIYGDEGLLFAPTTPRVVGYVVLKTPRTRWRGGLRFLLNLF